MFDSKELSLKGMILSVMLRWRLIIVFMLVFAVIVSYVMYKRGGSILPSGTETVTKEETGTESIEVIKVNISTLAELYKEYDRISDRIKKNETLGLEPDKLKYAYVQYHIVGDFEKEKADNLSSIITSYKLYYSGKDYVDSVLRALNSEADPALYSAYVLMNVEGGDFVLRMPCTQDMDGRKLLQVMKELSENEMNKLKETMDHTLELVGEGYEDGKDSTISKEQKDLIASKNSANSSITSITKNMTKEHVQYAKELAGETITEDELTTILESKTQNEGEEDENTKRVGTKAIILYALIGAMVGLAFIVFILCEIYVFSGKLHSVQELTKNAALFVVGTIEVPMKRRMLGVDKLIRAYLHNNRRGYDIDQQISVVASSVKLLLKKNDLNRILLTSSLFGKVDKSIVDELISAINAEGINADIVDNIVYNREALLECAKEGSILLLEQIDRSLLSEIEREIRSAEGYGICILGTIVLE